MIASFRLRSDVFASLTPQPVGHRCCEMCHAYSLLSHSQSKKWRPGWRVGGFVWILVAVLAFVSSVGDAMPPRRSFGRDAPELNNKLMGYLESFGYLSEVKGGPGSLRSADQLKDALRNLQAFAGLPATGQLDVETQRLLQKPRCGLPDITLQHAKRKRRRRYAVQGQKWHTLNITWSLQTQRLLSLDHGKVRRELHRALDLWAQNSQLTFQEVASENADIVINFHRGYHGDGYPFDGQGLILAHAFFPGPGRGGDVHFDEDEVWQVDGDSNQVGGTSLFSVAAHEFGHSLGLSHSSVVGALMYPWYHGLVDSYRLPEDDRHGIQQLYGSKGKLWAKIPVYTPSHDDRNHPRRHHPTTAPTTTSTTTTTTTTSARPRPDEPETCDTSYDAVSVIRSEVFIFREKYMWRISDKGLMTGYPALITRLWNHLPKDLTHIDAAYERTDKKIVFFIGRHYYVFRGNTLERGSPQPLTSLGLPHSLEKVDSAFVWGHNSKTYIFAGDKYWKLDDDEGKVERDYPRDMSSVWKGVGYPVDAVFQWKDGATYFFKGKGFWKFNDILMRVESARPMLSAPFWMGCARPKIDQTTDSTDTKDGSNAARLTPPTIHFTLISIAMYTLFR